MPTFEGFPEGKLRQTPLPEPFFSQLLPQIDDLDELKLTLHIFWRLGQMEGTFRYLRRSDLECDQAFLQSLQSSPGQAQEALNQALAKAVARGTLLQARPGDRQEELFFLNSPKGRAAVQAIEDGTWRPAGEESAPSEPPPETPNIFRLYEDNIGPLTPLLAEALGEAEDTYPIEWIQEAIRIAVEKNKRNWRYAAAILERWQREGRHDRKEKFKDRRDSEKTGQRYVEGEFSDFIEH
ncbi:MAG: DnaD domain protein [Anaerolineales bacterium]|nr:DnaD domain protein [Anaerolineales bacterium]